MLVRPLPLAAVLAIACAVPPLTGCHSRKAPVAAAAPAEAPAPKATAAPKAKAPESDSEAMAALRANFARVNFEFNRSTLTPEARELLTANAAILTRHPSVKVMIEGHTDHWGSTEYNLALGQQRAETVYGYLARLGVPESQIDKMSIGEERPLVPAGSKAQEAPNRRAEFVVVLGEAVAGSSAGSAPLRVILTQGAQDL